MDRFIKNIKQKLSVDNITDKKKDAKDDVKEQDVRNTLGKLDPDTVLDVDEMAGKLQELSEEARAKAAKNEVSTSQKILDVAKSSIGVLQKGNEPEAEKPGSTENDYLKALGREENVFKLYDDFN